ncbi:MAG TPA: PAS domain-containing protein [Candidatus Goldiibacteriota bacterium]|nr:PAS domain-containing protein [Candidatus Goldiibacteriota bacterium]
MNKNAVVRKKNLNWIRAILTLIILLLGFYNIFEIVNSKQFLFIYFFVLLLSNVIFLLLPDKYFEGTKINYVVFILDIIFISLAAYWLTYTDFLFFLMLFLTIFISALGQSVVLSIIIAFVVDFIYVYLKINSGINVFSDPAVLLNLPFIFVVAFYGSYLAEKAQEDLREKVKLEMANKVLFQKAKDINVEKESMIDMINNVYNSFRDGIIIIDNDGLIRVFNSRCETIFNYHSFRAVNVNYTDVEVLGDLQKVLYEIHNKKLPAFNKKIEIKVNDDIKNILVNTSIIKDKNGNEYGSLCTIKQVFTDIKGEK